MIRLLFIAALLAASAGIAHAWLAQVPVSATGGSCAAGLTTSSGSDTSILTASTTVVDNLTCN